jgi:putative hydrolase of the HAD superfamily
MIKGIIFDFDGLLVDTEIIWYEIFEAYFRENHNYKFEIEAYNKMVGTSGNAILKGLFDRFGVDHDTEMQGIGEVFKQRSNKLGFMPGIEALIDTIKEMGLQMGVATSSPYERPNRILSAMNTKHLFDYILGREDVEHAKPAPDLFLKALDTMGLKRDEVIVFEDSYNGYLAAKAAGIDVVIVVNEVSKHSDFGDDVSILHSMCEFDLKEYVNGK